MADTASILPIARLAMGGKWRAESLRTVQMDCLLWIIRGQGRATLAGLTRGYGPHNAIFIPRNTMHAFEITQQTIGSAVFFPENDKTLPTNPLHMRIRDSGPQVELTTLIDSAARELSSSKPSSARAASHYLGLISVWLERQMVIVPNEMNTDGATRQIAARYCAIVETEFRTGIGVGEIAAMMDVTPTHLSRSCKETSGRTALEILQERRLYEARKLLSETALDVRSIATATGFNSAAYFSRAFRSYTGKTPGQFRKTNGK